jgi:hypothetical protein
MQVPKSKINVYLFVIHFAFRFNNFYFDEHVKFISVKN